MDTPVKIIVATMILLIVAAIILSLLSSQTGPLADFVTGEREGAQCQIGKANYQSACDCSQASCDSSGAAGGETAEASSIKNKEEFSSCSWVQNNYACGNDYCCN